MPDKLKSLEDRLEKLLRYINLLEQSIGDLREQIETKTNIDRVTQKLNCIGRILKRKD
jgi:hypothetical protein